MAHLYVHIPRWGARPRRIKGEGAVLFRCLLATLGHNLCMIRLPKSLIIHRVVCGKIGTSVYWLHGNYYNHHNLVGWRRGSRSCFLGEAGLVEVTEWEMLKTTTSGRVRGVERYRLFRRQHSPTRKWTDGLPVQWCVRACLAPPRDRKRTEDSTRSPGWY